MNCWTKPELDPTKVPSLIDIAWAAGIYEGEGCVHERRYSSAGLHVTQKDPEILYRLRDWFGGSVKFAFCKTVPVENLCYRWVVCGNRARVFMALIYGFMSARRKEQIDSTRTLEFLDGKSPVGMSISGLQEAAESFTVRSLKGGTTPESKRAHKNQVRKIWRRNRLEEINQVQGRVM